jgi:hemerythrin
MRKLDAFALRFRDPKSPEELKQMTKEIMALLREWLVGHIIQSDLRMRPYVEAMKPHLTRLRALRDHAHAA